MTGQKHLRTWIDFSSDTINRILASLEEYKSTVGDALSVEDYKTLVSAIEKGATGRINPKRSICFVICIYEKI